MCIINTYIYIYIYIYTHKIGGLNLLFAELVNSLDRDGEAALRATGAQSYSIVTYCIAVVRDYRAQYSRRSRVPLLNPFKGM